VNVPVEIMVFPCLSVVFEEELFKLIEAIPASSRVNNVPSPFNTLILLNSASDEVIIPSLFESKSLYASKPFCANVPSALT